MIDPEIFESHDLKLRLPFACIVAGPSSSGKSTFIAKLIQHVHELCSPPPHSILYCYGEMSELVTQLQRQGDVNLYSGVPTEELINRQQKPALIILDDLLYSIEGQQLNDMFTKKSHHQNFGIILVAQDLFDPRLRVARKNSMYLVLTRAPASALAIRTIGSQLFPKQLQYFLDAYWHATRQRFSYLFIDLHPASDPALKLRSNIFADDSEGPTTIYIPKNNNFP